MRNIKKMIKEMSLKEKIGQMVQIAPVALGFSGDVTGPLEKIGFTKEDAKHIGSVLALPDASEMIKLQKKHLEKSDIPMLFMHDVIHGYKTAFPIPLAMGCSWDIEAVEKCARISAIEAEAAGIHVNFSPMADLVRDPRWGRVMESTGEDPYLNGLYSAAFVRGYQGEGISKEGCVASCVKHFAGYGGTQTGKDYDTVDMSERMLREFYLPAYKAAIDAGCRMVMTSFNVVNSVPASANRWLIKDVLREEMGFEHVLISDWGAIREMIPHGVAENHREATLKAITAGVDIDMCNECYVPHLEALVKSGEVPEALIDEAVYRILKLKDDIGLFENPFKGASPVREKKLHLCPEHREASRDVARKSVVLLKNTGALPLKKNSGKIALIGPFADNNEIVGSWNCRCSSTDSITLKAGLLKRIPEKNLLYARGCGIKNGSDKEIKEAISTAKKADIILFAFGEHHEDSGEGVSKTVLVPEGRQLELYDRLRALGKPIISILFCGRPMEIRHIAETTDALLLAWFPGHEGGNALSDIITGDYAPTGRLCMSFPYAVGQVPLYYNHFNTGRPRPENDADVGKYCSHYVDAPNKPLYPFGFGLTYTEFEYSEIKLSACEMKKNEEITASVTIRNTGKREGVETVQLYLRDNKAEVIRPVRELKSFKRIKLAAGAKAEVRFGINKEMLKYMDQACRYRVDPGKFTVSIGRNCQEVKSAEFTLR